MIIARNSGLIILSAFLLVLVFLLTFHLYSQGNREVLTQFQEHQRSYAKHLSAQIRFFFEARTRSLKALSSLLSLHHGDGAKQRLQIHTYGQQIERVYVEEISFYDERGGLVSSTRGDPSPTAGSTGAFFPWARKRENRDKVLLIPASGGAQPLTFILATPVYREASGRYGAGFSGVLCFALDIKAFLANHLGSGDPQISLNHIWIVDKDGTLLFQLNHPDMALRNIYQKEGNCRSCHISFGYVEEMLAKRQGTADYEMKGYPKMIAAFAPMDFGEESWVVVVNAPYRRITGFLTKSLREHLFLLGIVVLAFVAGSILVVRKERMKIKAEQELVRWQEKMEERRKAEEALQLERNKLKEAEGALRHLSTQLMTAQETERKRISRELHDELGQALTVMKLHMNFIEKNLTKEQNELRKECEKGIEYIDQVIENVRRLSRDLSPIILEDFGLSAAVRWLINNFARRHSIKVTLDMIDIDSLISTEYHTLVYRIVQEVLTNIGKHSQAGKVSFTIAKDTNVVWFSIEDDGKGFDPTEMIGRGPEEKGLGLATMRGRTQMIGGTLAISAEQGKGTRVSVSIPIKNGGG